MMRTGEMPMAFIGRESKRFSFCFVSIENTRIIYLICLRQFFALHIKSCYSLHQLMNDDEQVTIVSKAHFIRA